MDAIRRSKPHRVFAPLVLLAVAATVALTLPVGAQRQGDQDDKGTPQNKQPASGPDVLKAEMRPTAGGKPLPDKKKIDERQQKYLHQRYDLSGKTDPDVTMSGGKKHIPVGPTARLPEGVSWEDLGKMSAEEIRKKNLFPYTPLWHPLQEVGGMVFPQVQIKVEPTLERVDVSFDLPEAYLPEFPPPVYLTTRPDLGDVAHGKLITKDNFEAMFQDVLTPFQQEGLRLLLQKTAAQRHNLTLDRSTAKPVEGVSCFDCHVNGHTTGQFHLTPDVRPQSERFRLDTPTLRGVFAQVIFGSKRSLRSLDTFNETEENSAYFDGDIALAERKGARKFTERESRSMSEFLSILDFPPAPKLDNEGKLIHAKATESEIRGEALFAKHCGSCHAAPFYTDNSTHDLKAERFYDNVGSTRLGKPGRAEGSIKTFPLRGIKDTPPYMHDGRCLTLEDTVEFFNLVLELNLSKQDKKDIVAFMRVL